jgi:uracil-DNA glycosylase
MSQSKKDLLSDIANFLEQEREIFGPLSLPELKDLPDAKQEAETPSGIKAADQKADQTEPKHRSSELTTEEKINACTTLEELRKLCEQADELRTDLEGTNLVFGVGNPDADLMLIGEAPGAEEDRQGEPFVGAAGQLLNKILAAIDFDRNDVYIANILKHRPPENRNPNPDERIRSLPYLLRQIDLIQPKIILCLGRVSGTTLLKKEDSLRNLRGGFYSFRGAELTVTYHPAALLRNPQWKRPAWEDIQMVKKRHDELTQNRSINE